jgi:DNA-binding NtrC family response regulator
VLCSAQLGERPVTAPLSIGRGAENDWVLPDSHASRRHVSLLPGRDGVRVRDHGSKNGTFVNGVRIVEGLLPPGGRLTVGQSEFQLRPARASGSTGAGEGELIGTSPQMSRLRQQVQTFAPTELPILILGESGTGKELVARALHAHSGRRGPLVVINCGALPRELIESELFGHERGAFTGAEKRHLGCFGEADGGTLFLDEIGELPLELQPRLLRALENRSIRPVGATREIAVNVRIVAATHRDLEQAVQAGKFRADLFYRLCGFEIAIPALRERPRDIPLLVRHFLGQAESCGQLPSRSLREGEAEALMRYPWPGNVRELRAAVLRAAHLGGPLLSAAEILPTSRRVGASANHTEADPTESQPPMRGLPPNAGSFAEIERQAYLQALAQAGGSCRGAAEILQVPKSTLHDKLRRLGIATGRTARRGYDAPPHAESQA